MVKKFTVNCDFRGEKAPVTFYVGDPAIGSHPLDFQSRWLGSARGGVIPSDIMDSFAKLKEISDKNRVPFEQLCAYVIEEMKANEEIANEHKNIAEKQKALEKKDSKNEQ